MPKEHKKRGRREERKRKREEENLTESPLKRQKPEEEEIVDEGGHENFVVDGEAGNDFIGFHEKADPLETVFYGLLDQEEQDYYSSVNAKLELNDFEDDEDKATFVDAVYRESKGKELKVACSQSCSRYLERLILISTPIQLRGLFEKFKGNFLHLIQHRFASHCCETLFTQSARFMTEGEVESEQIESTESETRVSSFEELFLEAVNELTDNLGFLLTERFATHAVRLLILVLSGEPLDQASTSNIVSSRKKEKIEVRSAVEPVQNDEQVARFVPESFGKALKKMIGSATSTLNTTYLRALATHPTGNPVLQLLIRLELTGVAGLNPKDESSVFRRLFPEDSFEPESESAKFAHGLLYDPSGSRLIETIVQNASGKTFKKVYKNLLKDKMANLAKNDIASYVAIKIIQRLSKDDLSQVMEELLPEIPALIERYRVALIKALIERCHVREVDMQPLVKALEDAYGPDASARLPKMLKLDINPDEPTTSEANPHTSGRAKTVDMHGSMLAQTILQTPGVAKFLQNSLLATSPSMLLILAKEASSSRVLQAALRSPASPASFRRQFVPLLIDHVAELAVDASGSHVVDALWDGTTDIYFIKERIARVLQSRESELRESRYGRVVWRNWSMDTYLRRKAEWQAQAKGQQTDQNGNEKAVKKSALELAREKFAAKKAQENRPKSGPSTVSANA